MQITTEQVEHVARLARLRVSQGEKALFAGQLSKILEYVEQLKAIGTEGVDHTASGLDQPGPLREDEVRPDVPDSCDGSRGGPALGRGPRRDTHELGELLDDLGPRPGQDPRPGVVHVGRHAVAPRRQRLADRHGVAVEHRADEKDPSLRAHRGLLASLGVFTRGL